MAPGAGAGADEAAEAARWRRALVLILAPLLLLGPGILAGKRFLPHMPVANDPLAAEDPAAAALAHERANLVLGDRVFPFLTEQLVMAEELGGGSLPTWSPELGLGLPLFAGSIIGAAYPPNWLGFLLPPDRMAGPLAALSLILAGAGLWAFLRRIGVPPAAAAVGALGMQLGGFGIANLFYFMKVDAALWLPWCLWAVEGIAAGKRRSGLWLTLFVGLSILAGMYPIAIFCLATTALYALVRLPRSAGGDRGDIVPLQRVVACGAFCLLGVLAAGWQLLPTAEASRESMRVPKERADIELQALPAVTSLGAVVPDLFGAPDEPVPPFGLTVAWWLTPADQFEKATGSNPLEWNTFAGVLLVLLALPALVATPRRAAFPALGILLAFGFAQGWPGVNLLYAVPGLNLGEPNRVLAVAWTLWPWLAALGVQALVERRPRAVGSLVVAAGGAGVLAFALWNAIDPNTWREELHALLLERYAGTVSASDVEAVVPAEAARAAALRIEAGAFRVLATAAATLLVLGLAGRVRGGWLGRAVVVLPPALLATWPLADEPGRAVVAVLGVGALVAFFRFPAHGDRPRPASLLPLALAALLLVEGLDTSRGHLTHQDGDAPLFPSSPALEAVAAATGDGRLVRLDTSEQGAVDVLELARPNLPQAYGAADLTPYVVFTPRGLVELLEALDPRTRYLSGVSRLPDTELLDSPVLDLLRVTCVLSRGPVEHPRLERVHAAPDFHVYRRTGSLPPARIVAEGVATPDENVAVQLLAGGGIDPARQTLLAPGLEAIPATPGGGRGAVRSVSRPQRNRLDVEVTGSTGGLLVLHEQWFPGWKATVNGEDAELLRVDHVYRAVRIPPGEVLVRTWYEPWSLRLGFTLTLASLLAAFLLARRLGL